MYRYPSEYLKWKIFRRDGYSCQECGSKDRLELGHIKPFSKGGPNNTKNLITLCYKCNRSQGATWNKKYYKISMKNNTKRCVSWPQINQIIKRYGLSANTPYLISGINKKCQKLLFGSQRFFFKEDILNIIKETKSSFRFIYKNS